MASGAFTGKTLTGPAEYQHVGDRMYLRAPDGQLYKPSQVPGWSDGMTIDAYGDLFTPPLDAVRAGPTEYGADGSIFRTTAGGEKQYQWNNAFSGWDGTSFAAPGDQQTMWSATKPTLADAAVPVGYTGNNPWGMSTTRTSDFLTPSDIAIIGSMAAVPFGVGAMTGAAGMAGGTYGGLAGFEGASAAAGASGVAGGGAAAAGGGLPFGATEAGVDAAMTAGDAAVGAGMTGSGYVTPNPLFSIPGYGDVYSGKGVVDTFKAITGASALKNLFGSNGGDGSGGNNSITGNAALDRILGGLIPAAGGAIASKIQADAFRDMSDKYSAMGAPSRQRYEASFRPGFSLSNEPGFQDALNLASKSNLHALSTGGNPALSPNAQAANMSDLTAKFTMPYLQNYRSINSASGGLSSYAPASINAESNAIQQQGGIFGALGSGAASIFNPPKSLADILKEVKAAGY